MLRHISIRDFVIVDQLDIELEAGFTALTGETGAGKSILLDALALALGERADPSQIREGKSKAEITVVFSIVDSLLNRMKAFLDNEGFSLEDDGQTIILRRIIESNGRSRAFINGSLATLAQLKSLAEQLIDIHGQHAHQALMKTGAQRDLLDEYGQLQALRAEVSQDFHAWHEAKQQLNNALHAAEHLLKEKERLAWQVNELNEISPQPGEWAEVEENYQRLSNASRLLDGAQTALHHLQEAEPHVEQLLSQAYDAIEDLAKIDSHLEDARLAIESALIQSQEAAQNLNRYLQKIELDPGRLADIEERMKTLFSAAKKYRVNPEDLPQLWQDTQIQLQAIEDAQDISALEKKCAAQLAIYEKSAKKLTQARQKVAKDLSSKVTLAMQDLAMTGGQFAIHLETLAEPSAFGQESIEYLVAGHPGVQAKSLAKVASGGELARISLAISVITSEASQIPTLIFDEVDSGVGGAVAAMVGKRLQELGQKHQVLCVTHLPQVAACAHQHWKVTKQIKDLSTVSEINYLDRQGRIQEIARMLGGENLTDTSLRHAREMLSL